MAYFATHEGAMELFCKDCDFFKEDERVLECNALQVLRRQLQKGLLKAEDLRDAKLLEEPSVYNRATDELYEIDYKAMCFLEFCAGGGATPGEDVPDQPQASQ